MKRAVDFRAAVVTTDVRVLAGGTKNLVGLTGSGGGVLCASGGFDGDDGTTGASGVTGAVTIDEPVCVRNEETTHPA